MNVNVKEFKEKLKFLKLSVNTKSSNDLFECLIFQNNNMITMNEKSKCEVPFETEINAVIFFEKFESFVNAIDSDSFELEKNKNFLKIKYKNIKYKIECLDIQVSDVICECSILEKFKNLPLNFKTSLLMGVSSSNNNMYHIYDNILKFENKKMISTDGVRIAISNLEENLDFNLDYIDASNLLKIKDLNSFLKKDKFLIFQNEKKYTYICTPPIQVDMPDLYSVLKLVDSSEYINIIFERNVIIQSISLCDLLKDNDDFMINFFVSEKKLYCAAENSYSEVNVFLNEIESEDFYFQITPKFLMDIIQKDNFVGKFYHEHEFILFENENYSFLIKCRIEK